MRRKDREITDKDVLKVVMNEAEVCRLGLCDGNEPYVVPLNFGVDGETIYIHSAKEGRKLDIIRKNNIVCFETETRAEIIPGDIPCNWSANFCSIIGKGKAYILEETEEKQKGLDAIMRKYSGEKHFTYDDKMLQQVAVIKIELEELIGKRRG